MVRTAADFGNYGVETADLGYQIFNRDIITEAVMMIALITDDSQSQLTMLIIAPDVDFIVSHLTLECLIVIQLTTEFSCLLIFRGRIPGMVTIVILPYLY